MLAQDMGNTLREWRESKGISKYAIAKCNNIRIEVVTACEEGRATMNGLCAYLSFIAFKDRDFFANFTSECCRKNSSKNLEVSEK